MARKLVVVSGPDEGRTFPLESEALLLGRSRATGTRLIDSHVSRVHCQIQGEKGQHVLADFDSASGTFVNGKKITHHVLQPGDLIRIGHTNLQYVDADAPAVKPQRVDWGQALVGEKMGHFKIGPRLAKGRNGYVYHARDTRRNLPVVLKVIDASFLREENAVKRFTDAMKAVMPLRHPHLLKVYAAGKSGEHCWIAKEYVHGESLAAVIGRIDTAGKIDWRNVLKVGIYLARALEYAHQRKLVHQNVTPHNILLGRTPIETKLADLMVSVAVEDNPLEPISAAGIPADSLSYQSPERVVPGAVVDARSDLYSLGATMYAMVTGKPPFVASTVDELVAKIRGETPARFETHGAAAPARLQALIVRLLAKKPDDRFATARDLLAQLEEFAKEEGASY